MSLLEYKAGVVGAVLAIAASLACAQEQWWERSPWSDPERGFLWYPDPARDNPQIAPAPLPPPAPVRADRDLASLKTVEQLREELKRRHERAVMDPTEANLRSEAAAKVFMFDKSALYADLAQRVVWQNPEFDYNTRSPRSNAAQVERNFRDWADERKVLAELGKTHGLLFFFRSDCPYCAEQAPVLAQLRDRYHLPVLAVSLDGQGVQGFPDARPDNGISLRVTAGRGVTYTPAMYLISRQTQEAVPIAFGVTALEDLVDRIRVLTRKPPGERM